MATKDHCLFFKGKQQDFVVVNNNLNDQFINLNLNQNNNQHSVEGVVVQSQNIENFITSNNDNSHNNNDSQTRQNSTSFGETKLGTSFSNLNNTQKDFGKKEKSKKGKVLNANSSTLSLHITAYENSIDAAATSGDTINGEKDETNKKKGNISSIKNWKAVKEIFNGSSSNVKFAFELPRQQQDQKLDPEVMQFKASQRLSNVNGAPSTSNARHSNITGPPQMMIDDGNSGLGSSIAATQENTIRIFCVVSRDYENLTDLQTHQLNKAYEILKQYNAKAAHTSVKNVMKLDKKLPGFSYIIPEFQGELYDHLMSLGARIYGPLAIIQSLNQKGKIAKYPKPLLAMYCVGFNVTVTGLTLEERREVFGKIDALGGVSSGLMSVKTTHLFAKTCDPKSDKYRRAAKQKLLIVHPEWVNFAYEAAKEGTISLNNEIPVADYLVKIFAGCTMTTSGVNGSDRLKISELVRRYDGTFSGSMAQNTCTHLIIESNTGEKYRKALEWGTVKIVTMKWLTKCVETGIRLDEDDYKPGAKTSTQIPHNKTLMAPDVSNIFPPAQSRQPPASAASSNTSIVAGDHTMMKPRKIAPTTAAAPAGIIGSKATSSKRAQSFSRMDSSQLATKINDPIMEFDITLYEDGYGEYLEDCRLNFYEVTDEQERLYRRLGNCTGCSIVDSISSATHIIVPPGNYSAKQMKCLKEALERDVEVVRCEWLLECVKRQINIDTEAYEFPGLRETTNISFTVQRQQQQRRSSIGLHVPQDLLDAINPACDLSSMHNTRSFEERMGDIEIGNKNGEDEGDEEFEHNESTLNEGEEGADLDKTVNDRDLNKSVENDGESSFNAFGDANMDVTINERHNDDFDDDDEEPVFVIPSGPPPSGPLAASTPKSRTHPTPRASASSNVADAPDDPMPSPIPLASLASRASVAVRKEREENIESHPRPSNAIPRPSDVVPYKQDGLDLSMPLNEYLSGERPVKLHYPFEEMQAQIGEVSEPDSPTIDPLKLKHILAQMAKNSCQTDDEYIAAMGNEPRGDDREWRDMSLYRQPVDHGFKSPLKRPLPDLPEIQEIPTENFNDVAAAEEKGDEEVVVTNEPEMEPLADNIDEEMNEPEDAATAVEPEVVPGVEIPHEDTVPVPMPSILPQKQKSFDILPPDLLKRCEAVASHSKATFGNGDAEKLVHARKSQPVMSAVAKLSQFNDQLSFSNDKDESNERETVSPAKVVWEPSTISTQEMELINVKAKDLNFIPSTQQLAFAGKNNVFDTDSADAFQRLSNQNLFGKLKPKVIVEKKNISQQKRHTVAAVGGGKVVEEPVVEARKDDDKMDVDEPIAETEKKQEKSKEGSEKALNVEKENVQQQVPPVIVAKSTSKNLEPDSFNETWPEDSPIKDNNPPPKVTKFKAHQPRMFGLEIESEEGTENSTPENSINILSRVQPKPKRRVPVSRKVVATPIAEPSTNDVPAPSSATAAEPSTNALPAPSSANALRSSQRIKRKAEEAAKSPVPSEPLSKRGKRGSSTATATTSTTTAVAAEEPKENEKMPESTSPQYYNVIFTNFDEQEKRRLQEQVRSIQGTNLNETIDMPNADIVVCGKLQRSEKLMVALASGKFIVPPGYVIHCARNGKWMPRDEWEFGNPKSARKRIDTSNVKDPSVAEKLKDSCYRLRSKAESMGHGAFFGWRAIIFGQGGTAESLIRIIQGGGGEAKLFTAVPHKEYKDYTMAIISPKLAAGLFTEKERDILNQLKLPYYTDQVLSNFLLTVDTDDALKRSWHGWYRQTMQTRRK